MRKLLVRTALVFGSVAVGLALSELVLRVSSPRFQYAAEGHYDYSSLLIWTRRPNVAVERRHPDTKRPHAVVYNNLALRQHRDITKEDLQSSHVIAFFGDSFTENLRLPVQHGFVDILDFLLNLERRSEDPPFLALNFGVDGYGPDQEYLYYVSSDSAQVSKDVFYVFCINDLRNIYENKLLVLNEDDLFIAHDDALEQLPGKKPGRVMRLLSKLYLTYLVLEFRASLDGDPHRIEERLTNRERKEIQAGRFHNELADSISRKMIAREFDSIDEYLRLFRTILLRWNAAVEEHGGRFHVVILPLREYAGIREILPEGLRVIDLGERLEDLAPGLDEGLMRFENDGHWNETANMYAAVALYEYLSQVLGESAKPRGRIWNALAEYYASFESDFFPAELTRPPLPPADLALLRARYLPLENRASSGD